MNCPVGHSAQNVRFRAGWWWPGEQATHVFFAWLKVRSNLPLGQSIVAIGFGVHGFGFEAVVAVTIHHLG